LDKLIDENWDFSSTAPSPEDLITAQLEIKMLNDCIDSLDVGEQKLINALFFKGITIREQAELSGKTKSKIDRKKTKIIAKLKNIFKN